MTPADHSGAAKARDLFFPEARPASEPEATRNETPGRNKAGSAVRAFASLMDRALDGAAEGASGPDSTNAEREAGSAEWADSAFRAPRSAPQTRNAPASADETDSIEELEVESSSETEPDAGFSSAGSMGDGLAPNILLLPPPAVVIPFPVALSVEGGGSISGTDSSNAQWEMGNAESGIPNSEFQIPHSKGVDAPPVLRSTTAEGGRFALQEDDGIDVARLMMLPVETEDSAPDNIEMIDFRQPAEAKIIRLPMAGSWSAERGASTLRSKPATEDGRSAESPDSALQFAPALLGASEEVATSQLPGDQESTEEIAHFLATGGPGGGWAENSKGVAKAIAHGGLPRVYAAADSSAEATGISAARQEERMDSMKNSGQGNAFAGQGQDGPEEFPPAALESARAELKPADISARFSGAMDWQLGRPVGSLDRPSPVPLTPEQSATVDRISSLILRETSLVRQYSSDSMAVVLRPDDSTELYVHFAQRNGQIEATIRCDRGDAQQLGALWPQLQESLAQQRVRLAPLQEGSNSNFNHSTGFGSSGEGSGSQRHSPSDRQSMDERSAPASSIPDVSHLRGRGGSRRRLTTSRPGWETWA